MLELSSFDFIFSLLSQGYKFSELNPGWKRKVQNRNRGLLNVQAGKGHPPHLPWQDISGSASPVGASDLAFM